MHLHLSLPVHHVFPSLMHLTLTILYRVENDPKRYNDGYSKLRSLAYNSLDLYKPYKVNNRLYSWKIAVCE